MDNIVTYILDIKGNIDEKLKKIIITNELQADTWGKVKEQVNSAKNVMDKMGNSIGSMTARVAALKAQKEWVPAENTVAIRAINKEIRELEKDISRLDNLNGGKLSKWFNELKSSMPFQMITNPIVLATAGIVKLNKFIGESESVYKAQAQAETQLSAVMKNTMGARREDIQSILDLASTQQKAGVISGDVQLAGAKELSTYLSKKETLEKIMPVMNDMLAHQYGMNASQEQASQIATMLGKVMDGQTGALSRSGYNFDDVQEKILKYGTESERVAVLCDVVNKSVQGVNAALAGTPEGKLKQQANNAQTLQERIGKLVTEIKAVLIPVQELFTSIGEGVIYFFEKFYETVQQNKALFIVIGAAIGVVTSAIISYVTWQKISALWTQITTYFKAGEAAAWWAAVTPMLIYIGAIAAIIAAIVAIVGAIIYCVKHVTGWGETWDNIMTWMKLGISLFKESVSLIWLQIKDTFLSGFEVIAKGWYKVQSLWNKSAANEGLAELEKQRNDRLKEIAEARNKVDGLKKQMSDMTVFALKSDGTTFKEFIGAGKNKIGLGGNEQLMDMVNGGNKDKNKDIDKTIEATATGGTRSTTINIHMGKFFDNIVFNGGFAENAKDVERKIEECLLRVLYSAQNAG